MDGYNTLFLTNYFSLVQSKLFEEDTLRRMLIPGVNRDLEGSLMLYTERTTPCVSTPDSRPLGEHQPHMRSPRFIGSTRVQCTKDCAVNCKRPTHSNRSSHWHDDALTHANNHAIYNFIGGHQLDRWPVNQSLASMSKQQQFRSAGKPPNKQSATPPPFTKKRKREKKSQPGDVCHLIGCVQRYQRFCLLMYEFHQKQKISLCT